MRAGGRPGRPRSAPCARLAPFGRGFVRHPSQLANDAEHVKRRSHRSAEVAKTKGAWRSGHRRGRRAGVWPLAVLLIDWGVEAGLHIFCAVMAFSRWRFVRFAADEKALPPSRCWPVASRPSAAPPRWCWPTAWGASKGGSWPTWWCRRRPTCALPVPMVSGRTFARATTQNRRGSSKTWSATPNPTWWSPGAWPRATS